ncbi:hypothetical protein F5887DRAFT_1163108 [Amanita rubescens]|nr:hypothetical protein F5887DRAFT_1163108 [Amanita rubescens]
MLKFFRALFFLLTITAVMANARRVQDARPVNEKQFPSGPPIRGLRVEISHTMNPTHRGSNCVLYYRIPTAHVPIASRDDVINFCYGPNAEMSIFFYSMSDQAGQISLSLALPEGTELQRRVVGSWRHWVPSASDDYDRRLELLVVSLRDHGPFFQFVPNDPLSIQSMRENSLTIDYHPSPENEDSFWYRAPTVEYPNNQDLKDVMKLHPDGHKTFYKLIGEPGEMTDNAVMNPDERSLGIWFRMPQKTVTTIYRSDMLISWHDGNRYHLKVHRTEVKMIGWDPAHPL